MPGPGSAGVAEVSVLIFRRILCISALFSLFSCVSTQKLDMPAYDKGWDVSVTSALQEAHSALQESREPAERATQAVYLSAALLAMNANRPALYYARLADDEFNRSESIDYDQLLESIRILYGLEQLELAQSQTGLFLDSLTLSGDSPLQARYLGKILAMAFAIEQVDTDEYRRISDRILFIGDAGIRAEALQDTLILMWQYDVPGDITGLVQHAIAAAAGIKEPVVQAAAFLHLAGLVNQLKRPVSGVDVQQLVRRGMGLWRGADLWMIDRKSAAMAVRGSLMALQGDLLPEILAGVPGDSARVEILASQADWFLQNGMRQEAALLAGMAQEYIEAIDSDELRAVAYSRVAKVLLLLEQPDVAFAAVESAINTGTRFWYTSWEAAYAVCRVYAAGGRVDDLVQIASDQREPLNQLKVYLSLYADVPEKEMEQLHGTLLGEVPFLVRRVGWSRIDQYYYLLEKVINRAAERGDTALLAELRAIRPPQDIHVYVSARYAHAVQSRSSRSLYR